MKRINLRCNNAAAHRTTWKQELRTEEKQCEYREGEDWKER